MTGYRNRTGIISEIESQGKETQSPWISNHSRIALDNPALFVRPMNGSFHR